MSFELWGFGGAFYLDLPLRQSGYALLAAALAAALVLITAPVPPPAPYSSAVVRWRRWAFRALLVAAPLAAQTFLIRLPAYGSATPGLPLRPSGPALGFFAAWPWLIAAGTLRPWQAALVGGLGGIARAGWETHSLLTPVSMALAAALAAWLLRRDYRGLLGAAARRPLFSALAAGIALGALRGLEHFVYSSGTLYDGLDFAISRLGPALLAFGLESISAGAAGEAFRSASPELWFRPRRLVAAPYRRSLAARMLTFLALLGVVASVVLLGGDWVLARASAHELMEGQMRQAAEQAAGGVPYFVDTGRSLLGRYADELQPWIAQSNLPSGELERRRQLVPFFRRMAAYASDGQLLALVPEGGAPPEAFSIEFDAALTVALAGITHEAVLPPESATGAPYLLFLAPVPDPQTGRTLGVLAGWADLHASPPLEPVLAGLAAVSPGEAFVVDESGAILIHPGGPRLASFPVRSVPTGRAVRDVAPDGTRQLVYVRPLDRYSWHVVVAVPESVIDALAIRIAARMAGVLVAVGLAVFAFVFLLSRGLTRPLRWMARSAELIARGDLDRPVPAVGEDEIGTLSTAFERMRTGLKGRLEEMDLLLNATRSMASSLDLSQVVPPILDGVRELTRADLVRVVLTEDGLVEAFQSGRDPGGWRTLDAQIVELCRERGRIALENVARARAVLDLSRVGAPIGGLLALPLRHEKEMVGALWIARTAAHEFGADEVNLLTILAGQLGVSVANARLFQQAEQERLRLGAVLEATPDAVLVTDRHGRISLANPAAEVVLRGRWEAAVGEPAAEWVAVPELVELLLQGDEGMRTAEVKVPGGRVMFASATAVAAEEVGTVGQVCVLWDITHFKRLDMLKSEFVSTVSHDLRSPLTLMRGYATMLSVVGALNEQQKDFARKILDGVEHVAKLVDNLLDLGRIEAGGGLNLETVPLGSLIEEVVSAYRPQAANKQISLEFQVAERMSPAEVDPVLLRQAIANLIDNAIKYTPAGGRVTVRAQQAEGIQRIAVEDTGAGIAPADQARLFEKFYRGRTKEALRERGSGLGLAIVKSIIEQHGGRVGVESRLGTGSTFTVEVPLAGPERPEAVEG